MCSWPNVSNWIQLVKNGRVQSPFCFGLRTRHGAATAKRVAQPRHDRSHPKYWPDAGEPTLRRQDPFRRHVPLAGGAGQEALPHAWRCTRIRRAKGQPERAQARPVHEGCDRRAAADSGGVGGGKEAAGGDEVMEPGRQIPNKREVTNQSTLIAPTQAPSS